MKQPHTSFVTLLIGLMSTAGFSQTVEIRSPSQTVAITPPAIQDGSNWSRAPLPAKRQFDDVKAPDGQAIDIPASTTEVAAAPRVAIMQGTTTPGYVATTTTTTYTAEPALTPTGRATVVVPTASAPVAIRSERRFVEMTPPAIQDGSNWSRAPLPAKRQFDDVKAPDGQAVDQLPEVPPVPAR
jgi:hypothetical protein